MSKVVTSPIERWSGSVTIADPLTIPQAMAIEAAMTPPERGDDDRIWLSVIDGNQLPAIFLCVEKWELKNMPEILTADNFPASPRVQSHKLIDWLFYEIRKIYLGELEIPKELSPMPTDTPAKEDILQN